MYYDPVQFFKSISTPKSLIQIQDNDNMIVIDRFLFRTVKFSCKSTNVADNFTDSQLLLAATLDRPNQRRMCHSLTS